MGCNRHDASPAEGTQSLNLLSQPQRDVKTPPCPVHFLTTAELSPSSQVQILSDFASALHLWHLKVTAQTKAISAQRREIPALTFAPEQGTEPGGLQAMGLEETTDCRTMMDKKRHGQEKGTFTETALSLRCPHPL